MKALISIVATFFVALAACAQQPTTDYLSLDGITSELIVGGAAQRVYIKLNGSDVTYAGYNMDIYLPDGLEFDTSNGKPRVNVTRDIQPYTLVEEEDDEGEIVVKKSYTHTFFFADKGNGHIRVSCLPTAGESFTANSGRLFSFYVKANSPYVNPNPEILVTEIALSTKDAVEYDPKDNTLRGIKVADNREVAIKISASNMWSTCVLPFSTVVPEGAKAYTCSRSDEENLYLDEAKSMEAYKPYVLYAKEGYSGTVSGTVDASGYPETGVVNDGYLYGAIIRQTATDGYILQKQEEGVKFYAIGKGDSFSIPAGKCWLKLPGGSQAKAFNFNVSDISTGIENITAPTSTRLFDIYGRQRQTGEKGVFIMNGKKIIKK